MIMKLLIIGSEGFIGCHAVTYFRSRAYEVYSADIVLKQARDYFLINPERSDFSTLFIQHKFDACINATGAANVQLSFEHPSLDYILNTANVYEILNSIRVHNPACKFINLSSAAVYGNPVTLPISEDTSINPLSPYGYHKMYSEQVCREFHTFFNLNTISLRIFSAYGERLQKQLFWDLYKKVSAAETEIEMFGTGEESRDFIYVTDLIFAIECVLKNALFNGGTVNVASGKESKISDAVNFFIQAYGKPVTVKYLGNNKMGDPLNWRADIGLLQSLGFNNQFSLENGIKNYCTWLRGKK